MEKSVYSLVLIDAIVQKIDELAYRQNTNRSNLINQILAEYLSVVTPEKRMGDIFSSITDYLEHEKLFKMLPPRSDSMLSIKSPLQVKYHPTVSYSVELYRNQTPLLGELRVQTRTQSPNLLMKLDEFYRFFIYIEHQLLSRYFKDRTILYSIADAKLNRKFVLYEEYRDLPSEVIGEAVAKYIQMLDKSLKVYLQEESEETAKREIQNLYTAYLNHQKVII